jgi:hypothetical protein
MFPPSIGNGNLNGRWAAQNAAVSSAEPTPANDVRSGGSPEPSPLSLTCHQAL